MKKKAERLYPPEVLKPVEGALKKRLWDLIRRKKAVEAVDPYMDKNNRADGNAEIGDEAVETVGHMEVNAVQKVLNYSIVQVRKALTMIKIGTYGVCERCGKMIDTDRLVIMPETTLCVDCEKKREK
jgi:RNA polymerase-binding transcription factor DksA